jgi:hypothetical protein
MSDFESFEYVNLADIDPTDKPVPTGVYDLMVMKMALEKYSPKQGPNAGKEKERISAQIAITGDNPFAGRRLFHRFYLNTLSLRDLRKLAEATGMNLNQPVDALVADFTTIQPAFKCKVNCQQAMTFDKPPVPVVDPVSGKPVEENVIVWREAIPA